VRSASSRPDAMEDVQSEADPDVAIEMIESISSASLGKKQATSSVTSNVFSGASMAYALAQECGKCKLLVCRKCADMLSQRQVEEAQEQAQREAEEREAEVKAEEETRE
jgi:uncharacterized transporter YbjL